MFLIIAANLANAVAPPITTVAAAPTIVSRTMSPETLTFDAAIRHGDMLLWQGRLAMASNGTATFSQRRDQSVACKRADGRDFIGRFASNYQLTLGTSYDSGDRAAIRVTAQLERPAADGPLSILCEEPGSRTVGIQATIRPETGRPVTITADAGFSVTLTLR
ncbi:MAG TPA: hypothetical protein VNT42_09075 [Sphingomonas sp.]|nr:hypothetical protein [Sphingomonas sp.]